MLGPGAEVCVVWARLVSGAIDASEQIGRWPELALGLDSLESS